MIKINRDFEKFANDHRVKLLDVYDIEKNLEDKFQLSNGNLKEFYSFLLNNINDIIEYDITKIFTEVIPRIDNILGKDFFKVKETRAKNQKGRLKKKNINIIKDLYKIFPYNNFITYKENKYDAYKLVEKLDIKVCPYCNRQYTSTLIPFDRIGGTRPTLDHFLLKSDYPYLALSFWNLVPSCYSCNSQLRTTKEIELHPYQRGFDGLLNFNIDITDIEQLIGKSLNNFNIKLEKCKILSKYDIELIKAQQNERVFRINDIYQNHKDYVREIIQKSIIYSNRYSEKLFNDYSNVFHSKKDAQNMIFGNYTNLTDYEKRPLAKLTNDIIKSLGFSS